MKTKTVFACQECGAQSPKWLGRCADCGAWNSLVEERQMPRAGNCGSGCGGAALQPRGDRRAAALRRHRHRRRGAADDWSQRVRSRARRRGRAGLAGADWRRAGHRQVDAAAAGGGALRQDGRARCSTAPARNPSTRSSRAASGSVSTLRGRADPRSTSSPRPVSSGSSRKSRVCVRPSSSSTRSRPCSR